MNDDTPFHGCGLHTYNEQSARDKLTRHRQRGDFSQVMRWCDVCEAWHVGELVADDGE